MRTQTTDLDCCRYSYYFLINFSKTVDEVYNLIRGLSPFPTAFTFLDDKKLKIFSAEKIYIIPDIPPRQFKTDHKKFIHFACADGYVSLKSLQLEGKKKMDVEDFLRGYHFQTN